MSYQAPYIDASGYHYPTYQEILEDMVSGIQTVYGQDVYLGSDSMDYQIVSLFALKVFDCYQAVELAYNSHSPVTAIGTALDYIVALNGITRAQGTKSKAFLTLTGDPGTSITNGIVSDTSGILWDITDTDGNPTTVTIGDDGEIGNVMAVCRETGVVIAEPHSITNIMTPTRGWVSVDNPVQATTGTVVESDSALRARQALAVATPSQSILSGLKAALMNVTDVSRVEIIENDTSTAINPGTINEIAAHSVCCIVDGGTPIYNASSQIVGYENDEEIAETILLHKSLGCGTSGKRTVNIIDDEVTYPIKYTRPEKVEVHIKVGIKRLSTSSAYTDEYYIKTIRTEVSKFINSFSIGKSFYPAMLYGVIQAINEDSLNPQFYINSVGANTTGGSTYTTSEVALSYYQYLYANASNDESTADIKVVVS